MKKEAETEELTQNAKPTAEEIEQARMEGRTQGRAGYTSNRINMAFRPDVYEFIQTMARVRGETMTKFVNHLIEQAMKEHDDIYQQALKFRESL